MRSTTGESAHLASAAGLPPMATPMTVKMPEPMTAPMPRAVSETGPSVLRRARSGRSESAISLSMDLVAKICLGSVELLQSSAASEADAFGDDAAMLSICV
jgi:hypothetical protein